MGQPMSKEDFIKSQEFYFSSDKNEETYFKNVYMRLDGTIAPTPFEMPTDGLYFFDGQVFWRPTKWVNM